MRIVDNEFRMNQSQFNELIDRVKYRATVKDDYYIKYLEEKLIK